MFHLLMISWYQFHFIMFECFHHKFFIIFTNFIGVDFFIIKAIHYRLTILIWKQFQNRY
jgi:hypothetical protein